MHKKNKSEDCNIIFKFFEISLIFGEQTMRTVFFVFFELIQ